MDFLRRIDGWVLRWFDVLVLWFWEVHGVHKIVLMRLATFAICGPMLLHHMREDTLVVGVLAAAVNIGAQSVAEMYAQSTVFFSQWAEGLRENIVFVGIRLLMLVLIFGPPWVWWAVAEGLGFCAWQYLGAARVPCTPPRSRRREVRGALVPQGT